MSSLEQMLAELESHPLVTILAPSKRHDRRDSDMIRVNLSEPPKWYRELCGRHQSSRGYRRGRFDTKIKRANVLSAIAGLIKGTYKGKYREELLGEATKISNKGR